MSTTVVTPAPTNSPEEVRRLLQEGNQREQDRREGKQPVSPVVETKPPDHKPVSPGQRERSLKRATNQLHEEVGYERAKREAAEAELERLRTAPFPAVTAAPAAEVKPDRKSFASDQEFYMALGEWTAGQKVTKELAKRDEQALTQEQQKAYETASRAAIEKSVKDLDVFGEDWDNAIEEAEDDPRMSAPRTDAFERLMATSRFQSPILYWATQNPDEWVDLVGEKDLASQIQKFRFVEGQAKILLDTYKKKADTTAQNKKEEKPLTAAERDAAKPRPSSVVAPQGGTATNGTIAMLLEDGKTLNPAWKAAENARRGVRP